MRLEALQRSMMAAIDDGPDHIPDGVFAGGRMAIVRGFSVHANTISHARLVALEDTFPRTREMLGHEVFNQMSRAYVETGRVKAERLASIGRHLSQFLEQRGSDKQVVELVEFEWVWLESYHSAEAKALDLADLAGLGEERLLAVRLSLHPAARLINPGAASTLQDEVEGIADAAMILLTRPEADVLIAPVNRTTAFLFELLGEPCDIATLASTEGFGDQGQELLPALIALIEVGGLIRLDEEDG